MDDAHRYKSKVRRVVEELASGGFVHEDV